tara:strand:- start:646 stop:945 length:300 start_codon:yes stop_codon:yes gene_type:complete
MMTAARENLDPKIQSRFSGLSTLHLPLSRVTTRVVHLAQYQHSQKIRRVVFLSHTSRGIVITIIIIIIKEMMMMMMMMIKEDHRKTTATRKEEEEENAP